MRVARVTVLLAICALAQPLAADQAPVISDRQDCYMVQMCHPSGRCTSVESDRNIVIARDFNGWVWYDPDRLEPPLPALIAYDHKSAIADIAGRPIFNARVFYPLERIDEWSFMVDSHSVNTRAYPPSGLSPTTFQYVCAISQVIG